MNLRNVQWENIAISQFSLEFIWTKREKLKQQET